MKLPVLVMMNAQGDFRREGWLKNHIIEVSELGAQM